MSQQTDLVEAGTETIFRKFLQREVILRDLQINELNMSVSDMKGKFIKPTLKKVSKYENKFAKLQEKAAKFAFANQLKAKDK